MAVTGTNITLTTRTVKGSALTHAELDANQTGLKDAVEGHSHDEFASALGADDNYMTDAEKTKLAGIATGAEVNVQADWNASTGAAVILNKPSIPSISGLLNEAAHDALDHTGLPGVPAAYTLPTASTSVLGGVKVDGTTVLISDGVISSTVGSGGGVTDHGLLTGLSDDDHSQYYNQTRGDARYSQTNHNHNLNDLTEKSYNSLTDKPSIPSISGLLDETAHDLLDHTGLTGIPAAYSLPTASTTVLGGVKVDGTTVTISDGVISLAGGSGMTNPMTAAGDIIIGGTSGAPARLAKGTDGQFLGYVGGTVAPVNAPTAGTSTLIAEYIVGSGTSSGTTHFVGDGSAVSSINISDLDGNTHGGYYLEIVWVAPATSDCTIRIRLNGASDDTGMSDEWLTGYGSSVIATTHAYFYAGFTAANRKGRSVVNIIPSGLETSLFSIYGGHDGSHKYAGVTVGDSVSVSNVTSIAVVATQIADGSASELGVGSTVRIMKRK